MWKLCKTTTDRISEVSKETGVQKCPNSVLGPHTNSECSEKEAKE